MNGAIRVLVADDHAIVRKGIRALLATATPAPEPAEPPPPLISPELKNPDTYIVVTGAGEQETMDPAWMYDTASSSISSNIYAGPCSGW